MAEKIIYFAQTPLRGKQTRFGIKESDLKKHMLVLNAEKETRDSVLQNMFKQDSDNAIFLSNLDIPKIGSKISVLYVDIEQNFSNQSFANLLAFAGKKNLSLVVGFKTLSKLSRPILKHIFDNFGSIITGRVQDYDAKLLEKLFKPPFKKEDLVNLKEGQICLILMINGRRSRPFLASLLSEQPIKETKSKREEAEPKETLQFLTPNLLELKDLLQKISDQTKGKPASPEVSSDVLKKILE